MKNLLFFFFTFLLGIMETQAQFKFGFNAGFPIGDAGDASTIAAVADIGYFFDFSDKLIAGPIAGYSLSFGVKSEEARSAIINFASEEGAAVQFIPIGAGLRWYPIDRLALGVDFAYAIGVNNGNEGGIYYAPKVACALGKVVSVVAAYRHVSSLVEEGYWDVLSLGFEFSID